jgi:hypothetical protein
MSIQSQVLYHIVVNNIGPIVSSTLSFLSSKKSEQTPIFYEKQIDDERELDMMQMDRMIKWISLIFNETEVEECETRKAYKKELYNIYVTIVSDYKQYEQWKKYNHESWLFHKNTKALAKKILSDIKLFNEGLKMFSMFEKL